MAAFSSIALGIAAAAAVAGTAYQIKSSEDAKSDAKKAAAEQSATQKELIDSQKKQALEFKNMADQEEELANAQAEGNANRNSARARQRLLAQNAYGRSDTILTSPLGAVGTPNTTGGKTLLGL